MNPPAETESPTDDGAVLRAIARMRRWVRFIRAVRGALEMTLYGGAFTVLVLLGTKLGRLDDRTAKVFLVACLSFPMLGALVGALRNVPPLLAAQLLDRAYGLADRLANAVAFRALPPSERTPMMTAALADAEEHARRIALEPRRALRWHWPVETAYAAVMAVLALIVGFMEFRTPVTVHGTTTAATVRDPLVLTEDDIEAFREFVRDMEQRSNSEEVRRALDRFQQFIEQVAEQRLDRQEAFRRLQALQEALEQGQQNDREALRDALRQIGERFQRYDVTRPIGEALRRNDPRAASEAMRNLAQQLRNDRLSRQQRQELQQALQQALQRQNNQELQQALQRAREEVERLLRQQRERQLTDDERRMLHQRQRELERLQGQQQRQEQQRRQLARLDRAMSQAMQDLLRDLAQAAQDLDQGAEDLHRMADEQLSEQDLAGLRQQLEELRQRMRQQNGQNGQRQRLRLERFAGRARGGSTPGGSRTLPLLLLRGGGGQSIPVPSTGQSSQQGTDRQGSTPGGVQAGTEHDERIRGAATSLQARLRTVQVTGQRRGDGPTRAQVIRTAAQEGFTSQDYRRVHAEYWEHAREVVHAGDVPPGYRSYVRRYFQLIRPRESE